MSPCVLLPPCVLILLPCVPMPPRVPVPPPPQQDGRTGGVGRSAFEQFKLNPRTVFPTSGVNAAFPVSSSNWEVWTGVWAIKAALLTRTCPLAVPTALISRNTPTKGCNPQTPRGTRRGQGTQGSAAAAAVFQSLPSIFDAALKEVSRKVCRFSCHRGILCRGQAAHRHPAPPGASPPATPCSGLWDGAGRRFPCESVSAHSGKCPQPVVLGFPGLQSPLGGTPAPLRHPKPRGPNAEPPAPQQFGTRQSRSHGLTSTRSTGRINYSQEVNWETGLRLGLWCRWESGCSLGIPSDLGRLWGALGGAARGSIQNHRGQGSGRAPRGSPRGGGRG